MGEEILFDVRGDGIAWLTFNRPAARNAMTLGMYARLEEVCKGAARHPSVRVLLLRGAGDKAFVAGTDISEFRNFSNAEDGIAYEASMSRVLDVLEELPIPTIAVLQGACTGGGAAIAAACDLRIGDPSARFGFPIARTLGNTLSTRNLARLAALLGVAKTKELLFLARLMNAEEMRAAGLLSEIVPAEGLHARAEAMAATLLEHAPITLRTCKSELGRVLRSAAPPEGEAHVIEAYTSDDFKEGVDSFLVKRTPHWRGQ
ncbi:enoyl-CoA hydratase [Pendulispora rubella]|uniref:Enoyl-CoA hydratase n=1 Tax=Pendulispora rubella TaxID=2741070 RepID=A0ABZ2KSF6_9BACT